MASKWLTFESFSILFKSQGTAAFRERHVVLVTCILTGRNKVVPKVIFLHLFVILFTGGSSTCPGGVYLPGQGGTWLGGGGGGYLPRADTPPPAADSRIWSTSGRYSSYWNAFLCKVFLSIRQIFKMSHFFLPEISVAFFGTHIPRIKKMNIFHHEKVILSLTKLKAWKCYYSEKTTNKTRISVDNFPIPLPLRKTLLPSVAG